jgi:hypothetical protein
LRPWQIVFGTGWNVPHLREHRFELALAASRGSVCQVLFRHEGGEFLRDSRVDHLVERDTFTLRNLCELAVD